MLPAKASLAQLQTFARGTPGGRCLILEPERQPADLFYAGRQFAPLKHLLPLALRFLALPAYGQIDVFSGKRSNRYALPAWQLDRGRTGDEPLGWQFRSATPAETHAPAAPVDADHDFVGADWRQSSHSAPQAFCVLPGFPAGSWEERLGLWLWHLENLCGRHWTGTAYQPKDSTTVTSLVLLDLPYLWPDGGDIRVFFQSPDNATTQRYSLLARRFQAISSYLADSKVDLILISPEPGLSDGFNSIQWLVNGLLRSGEIPEQIQPYLPGRVPALHWPKVGRQPQTIQLRPLDQQQPYSDLYPSTATATSAPLPALRDWLRTVPPAPPRHSALEELEAMPGLQAVKAQLQQIRQNVVVQKAQARARGQEAELGLGTHFVFYGNPGTGKTTVARLLGRILKELEVLPEDRVTVAERAQLVAGYMGQTEIKTNQLIDQALGGILFIDEAYSLASDSENDFGKRAIDTLLTRMENDRGRFVVIAAGYREEMQRFINSNPGLQSRFNSFLDFTDYQPAELRQIFDYMLQKEGYQLEISAQDQERLNRYFEQMYAQRGEKFGNARDVRNALGQLLGLHSQRLAPLLQTQPDHPELFLLTSTDLNAWLEQRQN